MTQSNTLPDDIVKSLLNIGRVDWASTEVQSDEDHVADFKRTLELTRENFGTEGDVALHYVAIEGTGIVVAHTGTSPNSPQHARVMAGAWNHLVEMAEAQARLNATEAAE